MLRHIVLFKFRPETSPEARERMTKMLVELGKLPGVKEWSIGRQIRTDRAYHLAEVSAFESEEDFQKFRSRPEHAAVLEVMKEIADWEVVDYVD